MVVTELFLPALEVSIPDYLLAKPINLNEELELALDYPLDNKTSADDLFYSVSVIYDKDVRATFEVAYLTFRF